MVLRILYLIFLTQRNIKESRYKKKGVSSIKKCQTIQTYLKYNIISKILFVLGYLLILKPFQNICIICTSLQFYKLIKELYEIIICRNIQIILIWNQYYNRLFLSLKMNIKKHKKNKRLI